MTDVRNNRVARINYLMDRIENLVRMEIKLQERDGTIESKRDDWNFIVEQMTNTRNELIHLATK